MELQFCKQVARPDQFGQCVLCFFLVLQVAQFGNACLGVGYLSEGNSLCHHARGAVLGAKDTHVRRLGLLCPQEAARSWGRTDTPEITSAQR